MKELYHNKFNFDKDGVLVYGEEVIKSFVDGAKIDDEISDIVGACAFTLLIHQAEDRYNEGTRRWITNAKSSKKLADAVYSMIYDWCMKYDVGSKNYESRKCYITVDGMSYIQSRCSYLLELFKLGINGDLPYNMPMTNVFDPANPFAGRIKGDYDADYERVLRLCDPDRSK